MEIIEFSISERQGFKGVKHGNGKMSIQIDTTDINGYLNV